MKRFVDKHQADITGTISCFDRLLFRGLLPLAWGEAMERFIAAQGLRIKDFKGFVLKQSERLKDHAKAMADRSGRPYVHLNGPVRKEDRVRAIASKDGIAEGLVCVLAAVEGCQSFKVIYGEGRPRVVPAPRKCLCLYYYFLDRELGLLHVRIQTWFPFVVQICLNGHDWLARQMDRHGIAYRQLDNAFLWIEDPVRAQRFADRFADRNWPRILSAFARKVNPLMKDLLADMDYYWVSDQAEFATDVMFTNRAALKGLYENLLKHATFCFSAEDVMTFLGRKLNGNFAGEIVNDYRKRWPGARVKHRMKENWIKMYDKHGSVLRVETVINHPYEFKVYRSGIRQGKSVLGWFPLAKGVANLGRYAEIAMAANRRYLDALAVVENPSTARDQIQTLARPVRHQGRRYSGFNPAAEPDIQLFAAVMRGEHTINGFRNQDVRRHVAPSKTTHASEARRHSARVSRLLKRLHVHGIIAKIPRSRRWRMTTRGQALLTLCLQFHETTCAQLLAQPAA